MRRVPPWIPAAAVLVAFGGIWVSWRYKVLQSAVSPARDFACALPTLDATSPVFVDATERVLQLGIEGGRVRGRTYGDLPGLCVRSGESFYVADAGSCEWREVPTTSVTVEVSSAPADPRTALRLKGPCGKWVLPRGTHTLDTFLPVGSATYALQIGAGLHVQEVPLHAEVRDGSVLTFSVAWWPDYTPPNQTITSGLLRLEAEGKISPGWTAENFSHDW